VLLGSSTGGGGKRKVELHGGATMAADRAELARGDQLGFPLL
jgi:hypothetical protein